jgi:hypothetical protein
MTGLLALALVLSSPVSVAGAKDSEIPTLLACTFGAPGTALADSKETHRLFLFTRVENPGGTTISQIDPDLLLDKTTISYRTITKHDGGELWRYSQSANEPTGTILFVLPKTVPMDNGHEARPATLGQYHGSKPRNGVCVIVRGDDAASTYAALASEDSAK